MIPSGLDTVLLDVDGTLIDSTYQHALAWHRDPPPAVGHRQKNDTPVEDDSGAATVRRDVQHLLGGRDVLRENRCVA